MRAVKQSSFGPGRSGLWEAHSHCYVRGICTPTDAQAQSHSASLRRLASRHSPAPGPTRAPNTEGRSHARAFRISGFGLLSALGFRASGLGLCAHGLVVLSSTPVLINGKAVASCVTPISEADKQTIITIEGLADGDKLHPVQEAFLAEGAFQCGYCTPGMILGTVGLLNDIPNPSDDDILPRMQRHLCRCCHYPKVLKAIHRAAGQNARPAASK
jgi:aerobic-type carbon monoxide dehydrogenase small subunit (CoxS/CutS family)